MENIESLKISAQDMMPKPDTYFELVAPIQEASSSAINASEAILEEWTKPLDSIMIKIRNEYLVKQASFDSDFMTMKLPMLMIELNSVLYEASTKCDQFGFYDDIGKANASILYSKIYTNFQMNANGLAKKPTQNDCANHAELSITNERMISTIFTRSFKIFKDKVEAGYEMLRTLQKIYSSSTYNSSVTKNSRILNE